MVEKTKKQKRVIPVTTTSGNYNVIVFYLVQCDKDSTSLFVETLWYIACRKFKTSIERMKNFPRSWIVGSTRLNNIQLQSLNCL